MFGIVVVIHSWNQKLERNFKDEKKNMKISAHNPQYTQQSTAQHTKGQKWKTKAAKGEK